MIRPLATFFLIGAMKAGTTSLHHYLDAHPDVFVPALKEPDFFSVDTIWARGLDWYSQLYAGSESAVARGDCSPSYAMRGQYPRAASRIAAVVPEARVLYLVRQPVERIVSMWVHHAFTGRERRPLVDAVQSDRRYVETSRYAWQLAPYLDALTRSRIAVESSERLRDDRHATFARLLDWIGVEPTHYRASAPLDVEHHPTRGKRLPYGMRAGRGWREEPRWPLDARGRALQRLTSRPLRRRALALPRDAELALWDQLLDDLAVLRQIVGDSTFESWGWHTGDGTPIVDLT